MKLYYMPGSCSLASHIILSEIGNDFEIERVDTEKQVTESGADFSKINSNGYVPALSIDENNILTEGTAILQYLADQNPAAGLAPEPGTMERARLHEHLNYIATELHQAFAPYFSSSASDKDKEVAGKNVAAKMDYLEQLFSDGRKFLLGDRFSIADAYLFVVASWTTPTGIDLEKWPAISAFSARISQRVKVKDAMRAEGLLN